MKVAELMTVEVVTVPRELPLKQVARVLAKHRISGVPVVDSAGFVVGVVSEGDVVRTEAGPTLRRGWVGRREAPDVRTAADAMAAPPVVIRPQSPVAEAARLMTERGVNRLPVVDDDGKVVGIVTRADLVRAFVRSDSEIERELREDVVLGTMWIDPGNVEVTVRDGEVTLEGHVTKKADAELLAHFARRVPGVIAVRSNVRWTIDKPKLPAPDRRRPAVPRR